MADLSICLAHKHTPANDAALQVALACIIDNTRCDYQLLVDATTPEDPYQTYNRLVEMATTEYCVLTNSDVFFAPDWDVEFVAHAEPNTILTGILAECGAIGVAYGNLKQNFGMRPDLFDRVAFETWAIDCHFPAGDGWYMPCEMPREKFLDLGGFNTQGIFMKDPVDKWFWETWLNSGGQVRRVRSVAYHLQNWSNEVEQQKGVRQ